MSGGDKLRKIFDAIGQVGQNGGGTRTQNDTTFRILPTADFHQIWPRNVNPCPLEMYRNGFKKKIL